MAGTLKTVNPTCEQINILKHHAEQYNNYDLAKMLGISYALAPIYRKYLKDLKAKKIYLKPMDEEIERKIIEMKALIKLCETTDSKEIKSVAKKRLRELSGIPTKNIYGLDYLVRILNFKK